MKKITYVPGAIVTPNTHTLPAAVSGIDAVISAEITRMRLTLGTAVHASADVAAGFGDHTEAQVVACLDDHPQADIVAAFAVHGMADVALGVGDHTEAQVAATLAAHAVHAHDLLVVVGAAAEAYGASGAGVQDIESFTGQTIVGGSAVNGGVQDNAAPQAHAGSGTDLVHAAGVNVDHAAGGTAVPHVGGSDLAHADGAVVAHGAAANPVVAAVPTRTGARTFTLDVDTEAGDLLELVYYEVGERVAVA